MTNSQKRNLWPKGIWYRVKLPSTGIAPIHSPISQVGQYLFSHALPREYISTCVFANLVSEEHLTEVSIGRYFYYEWGLASFTELKSDLYILFYELFLFFSHLPIGWMNFYFSISEAV